MSHQSTIPCSQQQAVSVNYTKQGGFDRADVLMFSETTAQTATVILLHALAQQDLKADTRLEVVIR